MLLEASKTRCAISPRERTERFASIPTAIRREQRDWSNAEHSAWLDLFLASLELEGTFDSLEVARAYLGSRAGALDRLIARGAFIEVDGVWLLTDYLELYDGRRPRHYRTLAQRVADADAREARGEALLPIERWARWGAREKEKRETERESEVDTTRPGARREHIPVRRCLTRTRRHSGAGGVQKGPFPPRLC